MFLIFTLGILTVESRTNRENNVYNSLKRATDDAIESVLEEQVYSVRSNEQFIAALTEMLCNSIISQNEIMKCQCGYEGTQRMFTTNAEINSEFALFQDIVKCPGCGTTDIAKIDSDLTTVDQNLKLVIEVVEVDYRRGLLALNIIQEYTNPMGAIGTCEYSTTVIFDEAKIHDTYVINYYDVTGVLIQSYVVRAGDPWPEPSDAIKTQYGITAWGTNVGGGGEIFTIPDYVPSDTADNGKNITQYVQYDASTGCVNLYGNYSN